MTASATRSLLLASISLGILGDVLMHNGPVGAGFAVWIALVALTLFALADRAQRPVPPSAAAWLAVAVLAATAAIWRNAEELRLLDILATATALGGAAMLVSGRLASIAQTSIRRLASAVVSTIGNIARGLQPLLGEELRVASEHARDTDGWRVVLRSSAIGVALLVVFGGLLRGADPLFASFVSLPSFDFGVAAGHLVLITIMAWIVAGWARGALVPASPAGETSLRRFLGAPEISTALGVLNVLFAAFVATQLAWFFGGETFLRAHTGLTVAEYARRGFFQMVWVVLLVVPVLLVTRATMRDEHGVARRHTLLAVPLVALLGVMIVSAMLRMRLYVNYYGLTTDRLYPLVFMGWLAFVLLLICATVLRDRNGFVLGVLVSGFVVLGGLNAADPDRLVARVNLARAERAGYDKLDVDHLSALRGGAVPLAVATVIDDRRALDSKQRCVAARRLLTRWGSTAWIARWSDMDAAWRDWNHDDAVAMAAVGAHSGELRAVMHRACPR